MAALGDGADLGAGGTVLPSSGEEENSPMLVATPPVAATTAAAGVGASVASAREARMGAGGGAGAVAAGERGGGARGARWRGAALTSAWRRGGAVSPEAQGVLGLQGRRPPPALLPATQSQRDFSRIKECFFSFGILSVHVCLVHRAAGGACGVCSAEEIKNVLVVIEMVFSCIIQKYGCAVQDEI
ncbi:hypothetical protein E2562_034771 [Oryza meyeriana var. granulata]|uniref:Uncharacterized protein n=1 Tax=Oryza meyeriana var. granulata TaxID=110450 RepID=A0A6G1CJ87_9ORYZ|nr:hypothetical protein E2562_034771 [Oryza meyeriana var. granulata]